MTVEQIKKSQARQAVAFEVAAKIRALLDEAAVEYNKAYGKGAFQEDEVEQRALDLVTDEEG